MNWEQISAASASITSSLTSLLLTALSVVVGVVFVLRGFKRMVDHGKGANPHEGVFGYVAINFATGAAMLQLSFFIQSIVTSVFGSNVQPPSDALSYMPDKIKGTPVLDAMITAGAMWVSVIGVIAIFRSFVIFNSLAKNNAQQGAVWKAIWHLVFGAAATNIAGTVAVIFVGGG